MYQKRFSFGKMLATSIATVALGYYWAWSLGDLIRQARYGGETQTPRVELKRLIPENTRNIPFAIENYLSPNFSKAENRRIDLIVLHTTEGSGIGALAELTNHKKPDKRVSAHYLIMENGEVVRLVQEKDIAWHCNGQNKKSIGIEFAGYYNQDLHTAQVSNGAGLIREILNRYHLSKERVKAHSELDPKRRKDPGKRNLERILAKL